MAGCKVGKNPRKNRSERTNEFDHRKAANYIKRLTGEGVLSQVRAAVRRTPKTPERIVSGTKIVTTPGGRGAYKRSKITEGLCAEYEFREEFIKHALFSNEKIPDEVLIAARSAYKELGRDLEADVG